MQAVWLGKEIWPSAPSLTATLPLEGIAMATRDYTAAAKNIDTNAEGAEAAFFQAVRDTVDDRTKAARLGAALDLLAEQPVSTLRGLSAMARVVRHIFAGDDRADYLVRALAEGVLSLAAHGEGHLNTAIGLGREYDELEAAMDAESEARALLQLPKRQQQRQVSHQAAQRRVESLTARIEAIEGLVLATPARSLSDVLGQLTLARDAVETVRVSTDDARLRAVDISLSSCLQQLCRTLGQHPVALQSMMPADLVEPAGEAE